MRERERERGREGERERGRGRERERERERGREGEGEGERGREGKGGTHTECIQWFRNLARFVISGISYAPANYQTCYHGRTCYKIVQRRDIHD